VARLLEHRHGVRAVVATSDDPEASARIARFGTSTDPWIVAVRMVSEGVDLPRLRVGVYATTTTTELFFRQAVGRLLRWRPDDDDAKAWLFIPDDSRLRARAQQIADQRRHSLRAAGNARAEAADPAALDAAPEEQMSLFAAVSAVPVGLVSSTGSSAPLPGGLVHEPDPDDELVLELPPLPVLVATDAAEPDGARPSTARSARERRNHLRSLNAARAADLVRYANMSHAKVNAELNRLAGVHRITEATEEQLERRLAAAERWLRSRGTSR
jgi:hypothetical protein